MDPTPEKPSLASGMAKRGFWIALAGGAAASAGPLEIDPAVRAVSILVATALCLIAMAFGAVALIRITAADRKAVLLPGLAGVIIGLEDQERVSAWRRLCEAEENVGRQYNYAVSRVCQFASSRTPSPSSTLRTQMDQQIAKVRTAEQAADEAWQKAFSGK